MLDAATGDLLAATDAPPRTVYSAAWHPDGAQVALGLVNGAVWLWPWDDEDAPAAALPTPPGTGVAVLSWSSAGALAVARLAPAGTSAVSLWDGAAWQPAPDALNLGGTSLAWHPEDDTRLLVVTQRGQGCVFDVVAWNAQVCVPAVGAATWTPDGGIVTAVATVVSGYDASGAHLWQHTLDGLVTGVAALDGLVLARASDATLTLLDAATGQPRANRADGGTPGGYGPAPHSIMVLPGPKPVALLVSADAQLRVVDRTDDVRLFATHVAYSTPPPDARLTLATRLEDACTGRALTVEGRDVALLNGDATRPLARLPVAPRTAAWQPCGDLVALDGTPATLLNVHTGALARVEDVGADVVAWQPDGTQLALGLGTRLVVLHDPAQPGPRTTLALPWAAPTNLSALAWSPDGARMAVGGSDGTLAVLTPAGALDEPPWAWQAHRDAVLALAWGDAGTLTSSGGDGRTLRWSLDGAPSAPR